MSLTTFSVFYTSLTIDSTNNKINFNEGSGELTATLDSGTYSLTDLMTAVKTAMDAVGTLVYTVSVDRDSRIVTISSTSNFDLLISTGTNVPVGAWTILGFTGGADLTGATTHSGSTAIASEYIPQFILQDYIPSGYDREKISPTINESADGTIEVVSFGTRDFITCSFKFITDKVTDGKIIRYNPTGVADFRAFMDNAIEKGTLEFMPDKDNRSTYFSVILETTPTNANGTGYMLNELVGSNLPFFYEINKVKFRVV